MSARSMPAVEVLGEATKSPALIGEGGGGGGLSKLKVRIAFFKKRFSVVIYTTRRYPVKTM